ncbi:MAG: hypothetical protein WAT85_09065 [Trichococcus flocculiformis]|jgi:hypothetical protein
MLQPDGLLAQLSLVLYHRASTLEFLHQLSDSYRAPWRLLGLDFHQLAIYGLLGTHMPKKAPESGAFGREHQTASCSLFASTKYNSSTTNSMT